MGTVQATPLSQIPLGQTLLTKGIVSQDQLNIALTEQKRFKAPLGKVSYHAACHQRVQNIGPKTKEALSLVPGTEVDIIERCSGHEGTYAVKKEFHEFAVKIVKPVVKRVNEAQPDHYGSDCAMAGHHIGHVRADGSSPEHPITLLRKAYGV